MGFIPRNARWYLADVVLEIRIAGEPRNVVHINTHLIEAGSPEEAHEKALRLGHEAEHEYTNTDGQTVRVRFRGLRDLNVIHDDLEDGAEVSFSETVAVPEEQLQRWISPREQLGVFAPIERKKDLPNYLPGDMARLPDEKLREADTEDEA